jgi:uncharacterized membrane protein
MDIVVVLLRWFHIVAGLFFVGLIWWFNFVFTPFSLATDGETRKKTITEMIPRALYWFRWTSLYTAVLGGLLLILIFYDGGLTIEDQQPWTVGGYVMVAVVILVNRLYELLARSRLAKDLRIFGAVGILIIAVLIYCMIAYGHFGYRGYVIHTGFLFGIIMVGNVWEHVWPAMKKILEALKSGTAPDPSLMALVTQRGQHNTYLSVPLLWTMIEAHTVVPGANSWYYLLAAIIVGWAIVSLAYRKAAKFKG